MLLIQIAIHCVIDFSCFDTFELHQSSIMQGNRTSPKLRIALCKATLEMLLQSSYLMLDGDFTELQDLVKETLSDPSYVVRLDLVETPSQIVKSSESRLKVSLWMKYCPGRKMKLSLLIVMLPLNQLLPSLQ